mmetsp:Transcript_68631/g.128021  ORF Transcript_68631/g.128021 Transcript_68631/m.128021 type:complete len:209 (-) Transcript_68631:113-739(-)
MACSRLDAENFDDQLSTHRRSPQYSFHQDARWLQRSQSAAPGPGRYKVDRDFVIFREDEMVACYLTGPHGSLTGKHASFTTESRTTADGTLKGMACPRSNAVRASLGPGYYDSHLVNRSNSLMYTIPSAKESPEALRERKAYGHAIGPGAYLSHGEFDSNGIERQQALKRLARRRGQSCWASQQYSHIFGCMKPEGRVALDRSDLRSK